MDRRTDGRTTGPHNASRRLLLVVEAYMGCSVQHMLDSFLSRSWVS